MSLMVMVTPQSSAQSFARRLLSFIKQKQKVKVGSTQPQLPLELVFLVSAHQSELNSPPTAFDHSNPVIGIWTKDHLRKLVWNCHCPTL